MALRDPAQMIRLNLPGQEPVDIRLLRWSPREGYLHLEDDEQNPYTIPDPNAPPEAFSWRWYGTGGDYTVALTMVHGIIAGRVWSSRQHWGVEPTSRATNQLGLLDATYWKTHADVEQPPERRAVGADPVLTPNVVRPIWKSAEAASSAPAGPTWDSTCAAPLDLDSYHNVDVLVMYTPKMLEIAYENDIGAMTAAITASLDDGNDSLANSRIGTVRYILVGIEPVPVALFDYDTIGIVRARDELTGIKERDYPNNQFCITNPNLAVQARRNAKHADVVALARYNDTDQSCGATWVQHTFSNWDGCVREPGAAAEKYSYLVFNTRCSVDQLNLPHELGHVLGMEHDPHNTLRAGQVNSLWAPSCPWSFAHRQRGSNPGGVAYPFRSVMAYFDTRSEDPFVEGPPPCANSLDCPQVEAYSSTALEYRGSNTFASYTASSYPRLGVVRPPALPPTTFYPESNAWDTLQRIGAIVANFRARPDPIFSHGFE